MQLLQLLESSTNTITAISDLRGMPPWLLENAASTARNEHRQSSGQSQADHSQRGIVSFSTFSEHITQTRTPSCP